MAQRNRRRPGVKGRIDLGVSASETGAYPVKNENGDLRVVYRLRSISDGMVRDMVDDGMTDGGTPLNGRQALQHALRKTFSVWDGDVEIPHPMFFLDERVEANYARVNGFPVPIADKEARAVMVDNVRERNNQRAEQLASWEGQKLAAKSEEVRITDAVRAKSGKGK